MMERSEFEPALAAALALRAQVPQNRDILYMIAVCQRYLGRIAEALAMLAVLEKFHPRFSRLFQERGYCHIARRDAPPVDTLAAFTLPALRVNFALGANEAVFRDLTWVMAGEAAMQRAILSWKTISTHHHYVSLFKRNDQY